MEFLKKRETIFLGMICLTMVLSLFTILATPQIGHADATRIAKIKEVSGNVQIFKAGGSKSYEAFEGMDVTEGDYITTGKESSIVLNIAERQDELTIGEYAELYVTQLRENNGTKKTTIKLWSGAVWTKASALDTDDTFEIETPTELISVRGTHFYTLIDPVTGDTSIFVASGVVNTNRLNNQDQDTDSDRGIDIYPSQMGYLHDGSHEDNSMGYIDPNDFINHISPEIIEAILRNKNEVDRENAELRDQLNEQLREAGFLPIPLDIHTEEDLDRFNSNLSHLVDTITRNAVENGRINQEDIDRIINEFNISVDMNAPPALDLTEEQKRQQGLIREQREKREQQERERQQQMQDRQLQNAELLQKVLDRKEQQEQANRQAAEERRKQAEENYLDGLPASEREAFLERRDDLNREQEPSPPPRPPSSGGPGRSPSPSPSLLTPPKLVTDEEVMFRNDIVIRFEDPEGRWIERIENFLIDGEVIEVDMYAVSENQITILSQYFERAGAYTITVKARGYRDATVDVTVREAVHSISGSIHFPEGIESEGDLVVTVTALDKESYEPVSYDTVVLKNKQSESFNLYFPEDDSEKQFILNYELSEENHSNHLVSSAYYLNEDYNNGGMTFFEPSMETVEDYLVSLNSFDIKLTILPAIEIINIKSVHSDSLVVEYNFDYTSDYYYMLKNEKTDEWFHYYSSEPLMRDGKKQVNRIWFSTGEADEQTPAPLTPNTNYTLFVLEESGCEGCREPAVGQYSFKTPEELEKYSESLQIVRSTPRSGSDFASHTDEVRVTFEREVSIKDKFAVSIIKELDEEVWETVTPDSISLSEDNQTIIINHEPFEADTWYTIYLDEGFVADTSSKINSAMRIIFKTSETRNEININEVSFDKNILQLNWNPVEGAEKYEILVFDDFLGELKKVEVTGNEAKIEITGDVDFPIIRIHAKQNESEDILAVKEFDLFYYTK